MNPFGLFVSRRLCFQAEILQHNFETEKYCPSWFAVLVLTINGLSECMRDPRYLKRKRRRADSPAIVNGLCSRFEKVSDSDIPEQGMTSRAKRHV